MSDSTANFNILNTGKPGDTRELSEAALEQLKFAGKYESYSRTYEMDGLQWEIQSKFTKPTGSTFYILVCLEE